MPDQQTLQNLLDYNPLTGMLLWKPRLGQGNRSWNTRYAGKPAFTAVDHKGYQVGAINGTNYRAARVIYKLCHGVDAHQVDHIDGNRLNNRIDNLRAVTGQQNQQNMKRCTRNKSGVTGVSWNTEKNRWDAKITHNKKTILLGRFTDFDEAVATRKQAENEFGFHPNHGRET